MRRLTLGDALQSQFVVVRSNGLNYLRHHLGKAQLVLTLLELTEREILFFNLVFVVAVELLVGLENVFGLRFQLALISLHQLFIFSNLDRLIKAFQAGDLVLGASN